MLSCNRKSWKSIAFLHVLSFFEFVVHNNACGSSHGVHFNMKDFSLHRNRAEVQTQDISCGKQERLLVTYLRFTPICGNRVHIDWWPISLAWAQRWGCFQASLLKVGGFMPSAHLFHLRLSRSTQSPARLVDHRIWWKIKKERKKERRARESYLHYRRSPLSPFSAHPASW
jgi:hypothetical protein